MYRTDNLLIDLNSFTFKFGCLDSFSSSTLDVWYQIISIVFDTTQDFPTLFAKLPFPHWMNLYHDNFPPCLTLQNPRCLSLRFLPFSTSNVWTKIILHHVWRLRKIFKFQGDVTCLQLLSVYTLNFSKKIFWEIWCRWLIKSGRDKKEK